MQNTVESVKIDDIVKEYEVRPIAEARSTIGTIADDVAFRSLRYVLTKHGKALAAVVPVSDLVQLHLNDMHVFNDMARLASEFNVDQEATAPIPTPRRQASPQDIRDIERDLTVLVAQLHSALETSVSKKVNAEVSEFEANLMQKVTEAVTNAQQAGKLREVVTSEVEDFKKRVLEHEREPAYHAASVGVAEGSFRR